MKKSALQNSLVMRCFLGESLAAGGNAKKCLLSPQRLPKGNLLRNYANRYGILEEDAYIELMELGYYEEEGIEWEYQEDGYTG